MTGEVTAGQPAVEPPRMLLVFERAASDDPVRPIEVAAILTSLEEVFLVTLLRDTPPPDHRGRDWAWDYYAESLHVRLTALDLAPLRVEVAIPWHVYTVPFAAFSYGLAHVFGAPAQAAPLFERAREDFFSTRLAGEPKPEWLEWQAWLELKYEQLQIVPFRLDAVDILLALPPEHDPEPPAE
jgi:hypothetical protein